MTYLSQQSAWKQVWRPCAVCGEAITGKIELLTAVTNISPIPGESTQTHFYCQNPMPEPGSVRVALWVLEAVLSDDPDRAEYLYYEGNYEGEF